MNDIVRACFTNFLFLEWKFVKSKDGFCNKKNDRLYIII